MKSNAYQKDRNIALFYGFLAVAFIPTLMWFLKERPISSDNAQDLILRIKEREESKVAFQANLPPEKSILSREEMTERWKKIQTQIANSENASSAAQIVSVARKHCDGTKRLAPVFASLGYLNGEKVWTLECAYTPDIAYACHLVKPQEKADAHGFTLFYHVVIVSTKSPYRVLDDEHKVVNG